MQAAGLDVGWGQRLQLEWDAVRRAHRVERQLLPGRYQYKLIFDDRWNYDLEHPTLQVRCTAVSPDQWLTCCWEPPPTVQ